MANKNRNQIRESDITGLKFFRPLLPLLEKLHDDGTQRDRARNRQLHFDQYCTLVLLYLFNPIVSSLRAIQQASELKKVQRLLKCPRASLGSLSESARVFDPDLLREIVGKLYHQLQDVSSDQRVASEVKHVVTLVDGTLMKALPRVAQAMWLSRKGDPHHSWRLHAHFELFKGVPTRMDLTNGSGSGQADERQVLRQIIEPDRCYIMDRGYANFPLFNDVDDADSSYVCRVRDNSTFEVAQENPLTDAAKEASVVRDVIVRMGATSKPDDRPNHEMRLVLVKVKPHDKRSNRKGNTGAGPSDGMLRIATNLLDVPSEIIALLYEYRYAIELFFRFFKHILGCRHLISEDARGIEIQTYCAIIACMLISLWTGRKPTLRTYEMICYYFIGLADEEELLAHLEKLKRHDA